MTVGEEKENCIKATVWSYIEIKFQCTSQFHPFYRREKISQQTNRQTLSSEEIYKVIFHSKVSIFQTILQFILEKIN